MYHDVVVDAENTLAHRHEHLCGRIVGPMWLFQADAHLGRHDMEGDPKVAETALFSAEVTIPAAADAPMPHGLLNAHLGHAQVCQCSIILLLLVDGGSPCKIVNQTLNLNGRAQVQSSDVLYLMCKQLGLSTKTTCEFYNLF